MDYYNKMSQEIILFHPFYYHIAYYLYKVVDCTIKNEGLFMIK